MRTSNLVAAAGAAIVIETAQGTLAIPTVVGDGVSVAAFNLDDESTGEFEVEITISAPGNLTDVQLYGWDGTTWFQHGAKLNGGNQITLAAATEGARYRVQHSPQITRYALAATISAGNVTVALRGIRKLTVN